MGRRRGRRHPPLARRRTDAGLRRRHEVQARGRAVGGAGRAEHGSGSSRDWAAKGPYLLGIRAAIASSFERIHRKNLVGMGILPLQLPAGQSWELLGLSGEETFDIPGLSDAIRPGCELHVRAHSAWRCNDRVFRESPHRQPVELEYYRNGGNSADGFAETGKVSGRDLGIGLKCSPQRRRDAEERKPSPRPCVSAVARPSQNPYRLPTPDGPPCG